MHIRGQLTPYSVHSSDNENSPNEAKGKNTRAILCLAVGDSRHTAYILIQRVILGTTPKATILAPYYVPPLPKLRHTAYIRMMTKILRTTPKAIILAPYYVHSWPTHAIQRTFL